MIVSHLLVDSPGADPVVTQEQKSPVGQTVLQQPLNWQPSGMLVISVGQSINVVELGVPAS